MFLPRLILPGFHKLRQVIGNLLFTLVFMLGYILEDLENIKQLSFEIVSIQPNRKWNIKLKNRYLTDLLSVGNVDVTNFILLCKTMETFGGKKYK